MIKLLKSDLNILNMKTRIPFKYGIATLTRLPHLFVRLEVEINGKASVGIASDGLAPKWFTKNPETSFEHDIREMLNVIENAVKIAGEVESAEDVFSFWHKVYEQQRFWGQEEKLPPLLTSFGVSLVERALISAHCNATQRPFHENLLNGRLGFRLSSIHRELPDAILSEALPEVPLNKLEVRHTVGLSDPILVVDIPADERTKDRLPHSLDQCIAEYGISKLKIKLAGKVEEDTKRLLKIAALMESSGIDFTYTLDGNEQFKRVASFKNFWEDLRSQNSLDEFFTRLIFVEQPLHRDIALTAETAAALLSWSKRPKMIIDESDGSLTDAAEALAMGYAGSSHKNCKGVFKGVANKCLMHVKGGILSAEDLCNVGPVALMQDLAVVASLGVRHVERNGHHYMKGLSMFSTAIQEEVLTHHNDLYEMKDDYASLRIEQGSIDLESLIKAPFALGFSLDSRQFIPACEWQYESLE